jgi:Caspase domain
MTTRAAILIGVDKTGGLPVLNAAAKDAREMQLWLESEGFETTLLTDNKDGVRSAGSVKADDISRQVAAYVGLGTLEQLLIYFSGHGYNNMGTEIWLLSEAPQRDAEAINLLASVDQAKDCGVPNVIFISDACRSNPQGTPAKRVRGQSIFPNLAGGQNPRGKIDQFLATIPNAAAYEVDEEIGDIVSRAGIFTTEFRAAHERPMGADPEKTLVGISEADGSRVILSAKLAPYLERRVPLAIQERTNKRQQPECDVTSGVNSFIGKARFATPTPTSFGPRRGRASSIVLPAEPTLRDVAAANIRMAASIGLEGLAPPAPTQVAVQSGYDAARNVVADNSSLDWGFESRTGIVVSGAMVVSALAHAFRTEFRDMGSGPSDEVRLWPLRGNAGSVVLKFDTGTGTVVAGLEGYVASINVVDGRVDNVSYTPASNSSRWHAAGRNALARLQALRSEVAAAVKFGVFKLGGDEAAQFAERIRLLKGADPTLGLYASYAYRDADMPAEITSVRNYMRDDLGCDLFDVALLGGGPRDGFPIFPFCPMLMRGWSLLVASPMQLPSPVEAASAHILPALWTTFSGEGIEILASALNNGEIT